MQEELGPKGFQALEAAINDKPDVPGFILQFKPSFPIGIADNVQARSYLQLGISEQAYVPLLVIIDRQGNIRFQHTGGQQKFFSDDLIRQTMNLRDEIDKLLAEGQKPAKATTRAGTGTRKRTSAKSTN
jgi:hypothetical protein